MCLSSRDGRRRLSECWSGVTGRGEESDGWSHHVSSGHGKDFGFERGEKELVGFEKRSDMGFLLTLL